MFEKEAEEIMRQNGCRTHSGNFIQADKVCELIQKGAEFGYNLAKEEMDYLNKHWRSEEERKANEWCYPSKGELPKCDEETQLIFYVNSYYVIYNETKSIKRTVLGFYKKSFVNDDVKLFVERSKGYEEEHLPKDVIAWKEIVLPNIKED